MGKDSNVFNPSLEKQIRQVFETNQSFHSEWSEKRQGNIVWWDFTLSPIRDEDNEMVAVVSAVRDITESKKKKEKLWLNSQIITNLSEGVNLVRIEDGVIIYTNPTFEEMFGYNPGEMIGKSIAILNAPTEKTPEETKHEIMKILLDTGEWHGEVRNIKKDGMYFWSYANVSLFDYPEYGKVIVSIHTDITERKNSDQKLKESEEKWRALSENSPAQITLLDREHKILFANRTVPDLSRDEVIGTIVFTYIPLEFQQIAKDSYNSVWETGEPVTFFTNFNTKEGNVRFFDIWVGPVYQSHEIVALVVHSIDVTEKKKNEELLRDSEEKLKRFMDSATDGFVLWDPELNYIEANPIAVQTTGLTKEELIGKNMLDIEPNLKEIGRYDKYLEVLKTGEPFSTEDVIFNKLDKSIDAYFSIRAFKVGINLGVIFTDITESKKAEFKLKESEEKLKELIDAVPIGISISSPQGTYLECNSQAIQMFGHDSREEFLKTPVINHYYNPEDRAKFLRSIEKNEVKDFELQLKKKDGTIFWASLTSVSQTRGKLKVFINTVQDITERKISEEKINQLAKFPSENPNPILRVSKDGYLLYCNYAGKPVLDTWNFKENYPIAKKYHEFVLNTLITGEKHYTELECICEEKNSINKTFSLTFAPVEGTNYVNIYGFDITERVKAEEALRESGDILRSILENSPDYIIMMGKEGEIQFINRPFIGMQRGEINNKNIYSLIPLEYHGILKKSISHLIESGRTENIKLKIKNPLGNPSLYEGHFGYIKSDWEIIGLIIILTEKN